MTRNKLLKNRLQQPEILVAPGAADCLVAKIIEKNGFEAVYMTGAGISYSSLGLPDVGLLTMTEMVQRAVYIAEAVNVPVIADADTGYGNQLNVIRTVKEFERAGVSAIQLEDQVAPKRCGHLSGKEVIPTADMVSKIKAALDTRKDDNFLIIARTDARAVFDLEEAIARGKAYEEAGADILFIEAPTSVEEMKTIASSFDKPLMANMLEGGKTPLLTTAELQDIGFDLVIYPNAAVRTIAKAVSDLMKDLKEKGTTKQWIPHMYLFEQLVGLLDIDQIKNWEEKYKV